MFLFVVLLVIVGLLFFYIKNPDIDIESIENSFNTEEKLPYIKKNFFFSPAERSFYSVLTNIVKEHKCIVFAKVRLCDILDIQYTEKRQRYFNYIKAKHVDYLVCDDKLIQPLFAIELDDYTHFIERTVQMDDFVNNAFNTAGLHLIRIPVQQSYNIDDLKSKLINFLPPIEVKTEQEVAASSDN